MNVGKIEFAQILYGYLPTDICQIKKRKKILFSSCLIKQGENFLFFSNHLAFILHKSVDIHSQVQDQ